MTSIYASLSRNSSHVKMACTRSGQLFHPGSGWEAFWSRRVWKVAPAYTGYEQEKVDTTVGRAEPRRSERRFLSPPSEWQLLAGNPKEAWIQKQIRHMAQPRYQLHWDKSLRKILMFSQFRKMSCLDVEMTLLTAWREAWHFYPTSLETNDVRYRFMGWIFLLEKKKGVLDRGGSQDVSHQNTQHVKRQTYLLPVGINSICRFQIFTMETCGWDVYKE